MSTQFGEISKLVEMFDLEDYLEDKGFKALSKNEWIGDCPNCNKERKLCVNIERGQWHCWVCQEVEEGWDDRQQRWRRRCTEGGGGVVKLIKWLEECEFKEALQILTHHQSWVTGSIERVESQIVLEQVLDAEDHLPVDPPDSWAPINGNLPYLEGRGITTQDVQAFGLFWTPGGKYRNRVVFPVWEGTSLVYWQARALYEASDCAPGYDFRKCLNPHRPRDESGVPVPGYAVSTDVLLNLDVACQYPRVAVVEGPMDAVKAGSDAVCTFGKTISPTQIARMVRKGVTAVDLIWDGPSEREPEGAHPEMMHAAPWLSLFFDLRLVFLPHGDPGEQSREMLADFRAAGVSPATLSRTAYL